MNGRGVWLQPYVFRVQTQEKVHHRCVAGDHRSADLIRLHIVIPGNFANQIVDCTQDTDAQLLPAVRRAGVVDPAYHVQSTGDLGIVIRAGGEYSGRGKRDELHGDRGGADIHREAEMTGSTIPRLDINHIIGCRCAAQGDRHVPILPPQCFGKRPEDRNGTVELSPFTILLYAPCEPVQVGESVLELRLRHGVMYLFNQRRPGTLVLQKVRVDLPVGLLVFNELSPDASDQFRDFNGHSGIEHLRPAGEDVSFLRRRLG